MISLSHHQAPSKSKKKSEPEEKKVKDALTFLVLNHEGPPPHFDFHLELQGVFKSWALAKEPLMDSKVRRLATEVEDRPIETIPLPEKNAKYIDEINHSEIWDQGAWKSLDLHPLETLKQGHLNFELQGVK